MGCQRVPVLALAALTLACTGRFSEGTGAHHSPDGVPSAQMGDGGQPDDGTHVDGGPPSLPQDAGPHPDPTYVVRASILGNGRVMSSPPGIDCPSSCEASFREGTVLTLTATAQGGFRFDGFSGGGCSTSSPCTLSLDAARAVTATFTPLPSLRPTLTVTLAGGGSVTSTPAGILCGATCTAAFDAGTHVELLATSAPGFQFAGFGGDCSAGGPCALVLGGDRAVRATFAPLSTGAMELPVSGAASRLHRYPYLQVADTSTSLRLVWATTTSGAGQVLVRPAGSTTFTAVPAVEKEYSAATTGTTGFFQQVALLQGLTPGAAYVYDVIHDGSPLARNVPFVSPSGPSGPVRFIVFGDSGTQYSTPRAVRDAIAARDSSGNYLYPRDFIVGVGDLAYNEGTFADYQANFFDQMSGRGDRGDGERSILATRAFVPALGNHDYQQSYANAPSGFLGSFVLPTATTPAADAERYYSFDSGDAHFVVLDSMKFDFSGSSETASRLAEMLDWVDRDLSSTGKTWRVVFFHHTIFSTAAHGTYGDLVANRGQRQRLAPILQAHGVQLVMFGHDHLYQRSKRLRVDSSGRIVRGASCEVVDSTQGIVYVVAGNGGDDLHNRQVDPLKGCGTPEFVDETREYGDGYDFVATKGEVPVLFDSSGAAPTSPTVRHGFTHVALSGLEATITAYNYEGVVMDRFSMPAH
jgi:hypothetical protein